MFEQQAQQERINHLIEQGIRVLQNEPSKRGTLVGHFLERGEAPGTHDPIPKSKTTDSRFLYEKQWKMLDAHV